MSVIPFSCRVRATRMLFDQPGACIDDEGDDLKDLVDGDFEPSLAQKKMVHSRSSQAHHHENPDVKNLGALSKQVLGKDVESPKEKEKEEQKRIFAKAARTEVRLQKSLHGKADKVSTWQLCLLSAHLIVPAPPVAGRTRRDGIAPRD